MPSNDTNARSPITNIVPGRLFVGLTPLAGTLEAAVVETVSMTLAVVIVELKVTLAGDTAQVHSDVKLTH